MWSRRVIGLDKHIGFSTLNYSGTLSYTTWELPHDSIKYLLPVEGATGEPDHFQRWRRHKHHILAFDWGMLMTNKMINIFIPVISLTCALHLGRIFFMKCWGRLEKQTSDSLIWLRLNTWNLILHSAALCSDWAANILLWPNLFVIVGLSSQANTNPAKDLGPNQTGL